MKKTLYLSVIAAIFFVAGCTGATNPDQIVFPATNVSYAQDIEPYFALACVQCHDYGSPIDLSDWIGVRAIDVTTPYDTTCELVGVMYGRELHSSPIVANDNQRQGIKQWVLQACPNN
jgi:hypothetical protein